MNNSNIDYINRLKVLSSGLFIIHMLGIILSLFRESFVDKKYFNLLEHDGINFLIPVLWPFVVIFIFAFYIALFFLCMQKKWGLNILIILSIAGILIEAVSGIRVATPEENVIGFVICLLWGGVLFSGFWLPKDFWK